jgi:hypothetical protein
MIEEKNIKELPLHLRARCNELEEIKHNNLIIEKLGVYVHGPFPNGKKLKLSLSVQPYLFVYNIIILLLIILEEM